MKRRSLTQLLTLLAVFVLVAAACGEDTESVATEPAEAAEPPADVGDQPVEPDEPAETADPVVVEDPVETEDPAAELGYTVRQVPADYGSIQDGVDAAEPGDLVLIGAGVYNEAVVVQTDNIVIRGMDRNTVILDGENAEGMENGVTVTSDGVAIENLTVRNYTRNGLFWTGDYASDIVVDGYRASYVTVHNIGVYGIYAFNSVNGQIDNSYAGASDDSSFYIGQCDPCNALLYNVEGTNSQLGYSGTNSTGTTIAASWFYDNMIGVVPNSQDGEELAPNAGTVIVGNLIENNNNTAVPSRNTGFQLGLGTGVILAGATNNIVERNSIVDNSRAGVIIVDWIDDVFGNGSGRDYPATDNIIRDNVITGSTLDAEILIALQEEGAGAQGNCFSGNTLGGGTNPADVQTVLPCEGDDTAVLTPIEELLTLFNLDPFVPVDYKDIPAPELDFENMPGDPAADPPMPATDMPMDIDLDALMPPDPS